MDIEFGGGSTDVVMDLRSGRVFYYSDDAAELHDALGGSQYYYARSGYSGAGWVPDRPTIVELATMRHDVAYPMVVGSGEVIEGVRVIALHRSPRAIKDEDPSLYEYSDGSVPRNNMELLIVSGDRIMRVCRDGDYLKEMIFAIAPDAPSPAATMRRMRLESWWDGELANEVTVEICGLNRQIYTGGHMAERRFLETIFMDRLKEGVPERRDDDAKDKSRPWHAGLGLVRWGGHTYRHAGGIFRGVVEESQEFLASCGWVTPIGNGSLDYVTRSGEVVRYGAKWGEEGSSREDPYFSQLGSPLGRKLYDRFLLTGELPDVIPEEG